MAYHLQKARVAYTGDNSVFVCVCVLYVCVLCVRMQYRPEVDVLVWYLELHRLIKPSFSPEVFFFPLHIPDCLELTV